MRDAQAPWQRWAARPATTMLVSSLAVLFDSRSSLMSISAVSSVMARAAPEAAAQPLKRELPRCPFARIEHVPNEPNLTIIVASVPFEPLQMLNRSASCTFMAGTYGRQMWSQTGSEGKNSATDAFGHAVLPRRLEASLDKSVSCLLPS